MFSRRFFLFLFFAVLFLLLVMGALYVYKKKFVKIPTISPTSGNISDFNTKESYFNKKHIVFTDFENYEKKEELDDKNAYSGKFSYKVFGRGSFSAVIAKNVAEIGKENFARVGFSAYTYVLDENFDKLKADLVFSIVDNKGNNVVWRGVTLSPVFMVPNKWTKITGAFDIDINTIPNDGIIKVYLWNDSKTKILIDDILVVVGNDQPYRGDTTFCDLSVRNGWPKLFNYPPFPWQYLVKDQTGNQNSEFLIKNKNISAGKFYPPTKICTGNFYNTQNQKDKIIAVEDNMLNAYSYCDQYKTFSYDLSLMLYEKDTLWQTAGLITGKFTGKSKDEILLSDPVSGIINLMTLENESDNSCTSRPAEMKLNVMWEGTYDNFKYNNKDLPVFFLASPLSSSQKSQLLCVYSNGNWQIFEYQKTDWDVVAQSRKPIKEWDATNYKYNIISGKFLSKTNNELLLSVSTSKKNNKSVYSIMSFNKDNKSFTEINSSLKSKVWGIDTLKASDYLFPVKDGYEGESLMRYNTDWRFDLKHIVFNDTTYQILSNVDFKGYPNDYNPKFYEAVRLIPGCFIEKNKTSVMTICYNLKNSEKGRYINHDFLPNAIHFFTLNTNKNN